MENKLKDYKSGKTHYTPVINIILNNRSKNWYAELGKYICETMDIEKIPELNFLASKLKERKNIVTKIKDFISPEIRTYESVAMFFQTQALDSEALEKMFGKPLLHNEFGEGFDGDYDEETDEYGEPEIKESFASYLVNVGGTNFHIGYDHRGTSVEIEIANKIDHRDYHGGTFSDKDAENCLESLKKLVDLYKETVYNS